MRLNKTWFWENTAVGFIEINVSVLFFKHWVVFAFAVTAVVVAIVIGVVIVVAIFVGVAIVVAIFAVAVVKI